MESCQAFVVVGLILGLIGCADSSPPVAVVVGTHQAHEGSSVPQLAPSGVAVGASESGTSNPRSLTSPPNEFLRLHLTIGQFDSPRWSSAVDSLSESGNQFTLSMIDKLASGDISEGHRKRLGELAAEIQEHHPTERVNADEVQVLLETAAFADLMCHPLENQRRSWTHQFVGTNANDLDVRHELQRIRDNYKSQLGTETLFDALDNRVPSYAVEILAATSPHE